MNDESMIHIEIEAPTLADLRAFTDEIQPDLGCRAIPKCAMESLVRQLIAHGQFADAVDMAVTAVGAEPLRESAQRLLIEAHLAEGNFVEARRAYTAYGEMLEIELGVAPSDELTEIVQAPTEDHSGCVSVR